MITPADFSCVPRPAGGVSCCGRVFASDADARTWLAARIESRSKLLGRPLETTADFFGVSALKRKPMTAIEKIVAAQWRAPMLHVESDTDPFDQVEENTGRPSMKRMRRDLAKQARADFEARTARDLPPSAEVEKARAWADENFERALFNPDLTEAEFTRAEQLKIWALTPGADLTTFNAAAAEYADGLKVKQDTRTAGIAERRAALEAELQSLPAPVAAPNAVPGVPHGATVSRWTKADGTTGYDVLAAPIDGQPGRQLLASVPESEASPEIVAAAN